MKNNFLLLLVLFFSMSSQATLVHAKTLAGHVPLAVKEATVLKPLEPSTPIKLP